MDSNYKIRNMTLEEFAKGAEMYNSESWNVLLTDAKPYMITDPAGFFVGELNGEIISSCSGLKYGNYAHIGLYFVKKEHRGKDYGVTIFNHVMESLKDVPTVGLDALTAQIPNYQKQGFEVYCHGNRYAREAHGLASHNLVNVLNYDFEKLVEYDTNRFGDSRRKMLKAFSEEHACTGYILLRDDEITGYGFVRGTHEPFRIGPLVANDKQAITDLLDGLQSLHLGKTVNIDVLDVTTDLVEIIKEEQWTSVFAFARMYLKGKLPNIDLTKPNSPILEIG